MALWRPYPMKPIGTGEMLALAALLPPLVLFVYAIAAGKTPLQPALAAIALGS